MNVYASLIFNILFFCGTSSKYLPLYQPATIAERDELYCQAAKTGDANLIAFVHKKFPEPHKLIHCGRGGSLINRAVEAGDGFAVRLLIILGNHLNAPTTKYYSNIALQVSADADYRLPATFELIDAGANISVAHWYNGSPLSNAIESKSHKNIQELLIAGANRSWHSPISPMIKAMMTPNMENLVAIMLGAHKLPTSEYRNYQCLQEVTYKYPLVYLHDVNNTDIIKGENSTVSEGQTKSLIKDYLLRTILHLRPVGKDDLEQLVSIINSTDIFLRTPLHEAARRGHESYTMDLLELGADIHAADWLGRTPLHLASLCRHKSIQKMLLDRGADPSVRDKTNQLPEELELRL